MFKNLKLTYILFFVFSTIVIAWKTLSTFFGGVALNFVALVALVFVVSLLAHKDKDVFKRVKDLLIVSGVFCILELVIYFSHEFGHGERIFGFEVYQNVISFLGILFLFYIGFRFTTDLFGKRIKFIEVMLGNEKITRKQKKTKELTNGSLEEKPNNKTEENSNLNNEQNTEEETTVVIETEE